MNVLIGAKTHFSLGESILDPEKLVKLAKKAGYDGLVVTDVNSIDSMPILSQKADGLKVGLAVQIHVVDDLAWVAAKRGEPKKKPNPFFMPTLFVRNEDGFRDLVELMTIAQDESHYCTKPARPQISFDELLEYMKRGTLSMTLGSAHSVFALADAREKLERIADVTQAFVELVPVSSAFYDGYNTRALRYINDKGTGKAIPILVRPTLNLEGEVQFRNTMNCILDHLQVNATFRREPPEDLHLMEPAGIEAEIARSVERTGKLVGDTDMAKDLFAAAVINAGAYFTHHPYKWEKMPVSLPTLSASPLLELVNCCKEGYAKRLGKGTFGYKPSAADLPKYRDRLKYELSVLQKMGFESYFLLVNYIVQWSKNNGIEVGPGRGSVGGSLVAYLMGITDVDPIRFNLVFERFLNPDRIDLPDIDLDFMSSRRQDIVDHLVDHFGEERVVNIANYNTIAGSGAIREVSKVYGLKDYEYDCSKLVPKESGVPVDLNEAVALVPELEKFALAYPEVWKNAAGLQGAFRNFAKHAAGVIVAGEDVVKRGVINRRSGVGIVNWDKRVVEDFGLIKLDVLGLSNLDILRLAREYIRESTGTVVDFTSLPLDDKKVLEAFAQGKTYGVFQFESGGMKKLLRDLGSDGNLTFDDVSAATALFRPGPIQAGLMDQYVRVKKGYSEPEYAHPSMENALKDTYSVMVYQEQVMQVSRDVAGYSMTEADHLRKIMGKKDPVKMAEQRDKFVKGCVDHSGMLAESAEHLFDQIEKFAGYGFNKSHAVAYTLISYMTMWVKVYHPEAFFAACLSILDEEKLAGLAKDALAHDIHIVPPDINKSSYRYEIGYDTLRGQKVLYAPFQSIKGIAEKGAYEIVEARKKAGGVFVSKEDFLENVNKRVVNVRHQANLDKVGAFASVDPSQPFSRHPDRLRDQKELLPGIVVNNVKAERVIEVDGYISSELVKVVTETQTCAECPLSGLPHPQPCLGRKPKVMIITDMPSWEDERKGNMGAGEQGKSLKLALTTNGMKMGDVYLTSLIKARKPKEMDFENSMINGCQKYLKREIELMKPPVIVALGPKAIRHLIPDAKGGWEELCGKSHYIAEHDCTVVCGFNPGQIAFDESKQNILNAVFAQVAEIFA